MNNIEEFKIRVINLLQSLNINNVKNINIFMEAFTHTTYSNEHKGSRNYQYLEFLGDAIIEFIVTKEIYNRFPSYTEGIATKHRAYVVSNKTLSKLSNKLGISSVIRYSKNAFINGKNEKVDSDFFESFVGALFVEKGLDFVEKFILKYLDPYIDQVNKNDFSNPKSSFQELIQMHSTADIVYRTNVADKGGFISEVIVDKQRYGVGYGKTKKEAEMNAAQNALDILILK